MTAVDPADIEFYATNYDPRDPKIIELNESVRPELAAKCPVVHSESYGGFWLVNGYDKAVEVFQNWETFSSDYHRAIFGRPEDRPPMPPIDADPPVQREWRHVLNPYLTPKRIAQYEPGIRAMVTELIDSFIEDGHVDLYGQFGKPFPGRMLYRFLFGIDDDEVPMVQAWTDSFIFAPMGEAARPAQLAWNNWVFELVKRRRDEPRQDDMIDGLLHATVDGGPLTDEELVGCIQILILGGFSTTTDSLVNTMLRLAENPELQTRFRNDPALVVNAMDEFFRFDPPVGSQTRLCTRDYVLDGNEIKAGDKMLLHIHSANRDPDEFDDPNLLDIDRGRNAHLAFGVGMHRCIGSNVARMNLRIALSELLPRLGEFRITPGDAPGRNYAQLNYLPLTFEPGPKSTATS